MSDTETTATTDAGALRRGSIGTPINNTLAIARRSSPRTSRRRWATS
ncbi:MAG: hypothetical protein IPN17_35820 [Deltaproteobacteria bacterium]|nr:hypothetical protein [Deltaproteobacteria bacterium]